jgi:DNA polymerase elongation subunit (family B)
MIKFQVLEWDEYKNENGDGEEEYGLRLFGRTEEEKTIAVDVKNFKPFFFVKLDRKYNTIQLLQFIQEAKKNVWPKELQSGLIKYKLEQHCDFYHFTNFTKFYFIRLEFSSLSSYKAYERVFKKKLFVPYVSKQKLKYKVYESNIIPYLRLLHIKDLRSVGWIQLDKYTKIKDLNKKTTSEIEVDTDFMELNPLNDIIKSQKFTILSFDLECTSGDKISFPNPEKPSDKVIQIGLTMSRYGEDECYFKSILTLKGCIPLEGIDVKSYETEEELLIAFQKSIIDLDPDFITGYNIFGFDFKYLYMRAKLLNIEHKFARLSRIKNHICEFVETKLASSALGENILKYYKMPGRVIFDLMKVVQRDYKLGSYKLDAVAENFIRQELTNINIRDTKTIIDTKNTNGINIGQFIKICWDDGMTENSYLDSKKFKIVELKKNQITIEGEIDGSEFMGKGYKVMWAQAKDDISPQQLFELQEKTDKDRAIIARYCVQDCALCNKLIARLQIITNSIGMAIVCHVPISFLFLRGQGVKIYSLVAKKCRERDHLIPVLKKKIKIDPNEINKEEVKIQKITQYFNNKNRDEDDDEDDEDDEGYEGATVFEPKTGVHLDPIPVLDFSSLYPNSMRLRNLSHEMLVTNEIFMNLPGYIYHRISHKKPDGRYVECIFAEKETGTKGIIPDILSELLSARKKYKNQMEDLKENGGDPFIIAILDGLQQAYKCTANSLYGQTGAPTSPIYMKEIAASTTATGREMLQFSKYFIENIFTTMINLAKQSKKKFLAYVENIYKYFPTKLQLDEDTEFHIETVENKIIPDSKFIRKSIDFYVKKYEDMIKLYSDQLKTLNIKSVEDYENFVGKLTIMMTNNSYQNVREFRKKLKYLFDTEFDTEDLEYDNTIKEILNLTQKEFYNINRKIYTKDFINDFNEILNNMGYKNKTDMFLKFYDLVQDSLFEYTVDPKGIYGDTDSIFYCLYLKDKDNKAVQNKDALKISIKFGIWSSILISTLLPTPMAQEYEKVLYPFIIITKKRYVGNLYEKSPDKFKQKSMGIVLKRRDNANIVKIICGNIIDQILNKRSPKGAVDKTQEILDKTIKGQIPLDKFIITKTLKTTYKNRESIVHAVLADRMAERDPGNKPQSNDRIPYAYIELPPDLKVNLQGERVEHWDYIQEKKLKLDYLFYITNQIMKPAIQFLELIVDNPEKIFNEYIIKEENRKNGKLPINYYFQGENNITFDEFTEILDTIKNDTTKKVSSKKESNENILLNENTIKKNTIKKNTVKKNTIKKNTVKKNTVKKNTIKKNTVKNLNIELIDFI